MNIKDYKESKIELYSKANDMFTKTVERDDKVYIKRFKKFIDSNQIISEFIKEKLENAKVIPYDEFLAPRSPMNNTWLIVKPPIDEKEHITIMYHLLDDICNDVTPFNSLYSLGVRLSPNGTTNVNELTRNFLIKTLEPLVNFIDIFLDKEILKMETDKREGITVYQTIHGSNNVANVGHDNINIKIDVLEQDKDNILNLINKSIEDLKNEQIQEDVREDIIDNLELAQEQIKNKIEKPRRVKRAIESISSFIEKADKNVIKSASLITNLTILLEKLSSIIN